MYSLHRVESEQSESEVMLSPHHLGWPMTRPRLYTVMVHRAKACLTGFSGTMRTLFKKPHEKLGVHSLFVAPQDWTGQTGLGHGSLPVPASIFDFSIKSSQVR